MRRWPPTDPPGGPGLLEAGQSTLANEVPCDWQSAEDMEDEPSARTGRVDGLPQGSEPDASLGQVLDDFVQLSVRACQSVEPPDYESVTLAQVVERRRQLWQIEPGTR